MTNATLPGDSTAESSGAAGVGHATATKPGESAGASSGVGHMPGTGGGLNGTNGPGAAPQQLRTRTGAASVKHAINAAALIVVSLLFLAPPLAALLFSTKPQQPTLMQDPEGWLASGFTGKNYETLAHYGNGIWSYIANTLGISLITVLITTVVSISAGYAFARFKIPFKGLLFTLILAIIMVPYQTVLIPLYQMFAQAHLLNNTTALAFVYATFQLPFGIYMMRNSFEAVPRELEEAAMCDGCSTLGTLYRIVMPIVVPGVVTVGLFSFFAGWNEFLAPLMFLTDDTKYTLPIMLNGVLSGRMGELNYGALQAGVTISILPCAAIFLLLQKYYVNGLVAGAMKG